MSFFSGEIAWRGGDRKFASRVVEEREREREEIALVINSFVWGRKKKKSLERACVHRPPGGSENGKKEGVKKVLLLLERETNWNID